MFTRGRVKFTNYVKSPLCSFWQSTSLSEDDITNLSVTITLANPAPVFIALVSDPDTGVAINGSSQTTARSDGILCHQGSLANFDNHFDIKLYRASTEIYRFPHLNNQYNANSELPCKTIPACYVNHTDFPGAGTHTYRLRGNLVTSTTDKFLQVQFVRLFAVELAR